LLFPFWKWISRVSAFSICDSAGPTNARFPALESGDLTIWSCDFMIWLRDAFNLHTMCQWCGRRPRRQRRVWFSVFLGYPAVAVVIKIGFALNAINKTPEHFCWQMSSLKIIHSLVSGLVCGILGGRSGRNGSFTFLLC